MNKQLIVKEKYSKHWPLIAVLSGVLSVILFVSYQFTDNVLLEGYLRLSSFAFFALALLSLFKVKDGQIKLNLNVSDDNVLEIAYTVRKKIVSEEKFSLNEINEIKVDRMPDKSLYNDFMKSDRCLRFKRTKNGEWIYLNKVHGRVIPLTQPKAERIINFIESAKKS